MKTWPVCPLRVAAVPQRDRPSEVYRTCLAREIFISSAPTSVPVAQLRVETRSPGIVTERIRLNMFFPNPARFLKAFRGADAVTYLSEPRNFAHAEADYDQQYR